MSANIKSREQLKEIFNHPNFGREAYRYLIDSTFNMKDDGFEKTEQDGLKLSLTGASKRLISFYERMKETPSWYVALNPENKEGLGFHETAGETRLFLKKGGNVGIGTADPEYRLHVRGVVAMDGRVGGFAKGYAPADGDWHSIVTKISGCQAFEVMAQINDTQDKRYALTHATVLLSEGKKGGSVRQTIETNAGSSWLWGKFFNKIKFRWVLNESASNVANAPMYDLQVKSRTHYGETAPGKPKQLFYRVAKLWDKDYEADFYTDSGYEHPPVNPAPMPTNTPPPYYPPTQPITPPTVNTPPPVGGPKITIRR